MVLARPRAADPAMQHGADRALDPDAGIDVHDDAQHQHEAGQGMQQGGQANGVDTE
uniref:Efflux RND transporter periplasmic adaptor subunit n=1 Tax=Steinernema glaseri TaxID=37863 RepID=A0A1I8AP84_9BILA